jgi:hypothetical protein
MPRYPIKDGGAFVSIQSFVGWAGSHGWAVRAEYPAKSKDTFRVVAVIITVLVGCRAVAHHLKSVKVAVRALFHLIQAVLSP